MLFDIYGKFQIEVVEVDGCLRAFRKGGGVRIPYPELVFPSEMREQEIETYLDDHFHEHASPGDVVKRL